MLRQLLPVCEKVLGEKILGLGHVLWIPLALNLLTILPVADTAFNIYLIILLIFISISLVFDIVDVWKYFGSKQTSNPITKQ